MSRKRMLWQQRPNVEHLKATGDLTPDLDRIVREGYESLTGEDYYRLKMVGVCGQNTEGVHMMRIRVPGGVASCEQLARIADIAHTKADGTLPADAATTALVSVLVEPRWGRRGHGTRLVAEAGRRLAEAGATRGIAWVPEADKASKSFYERLGWTGDGTVRTLDAGGRPLREIRVSGSLEVRLDV